MSWQHSAGEDWCWFEGELWRRLLRWKQLARC
jgi:hypothetical protein